LMENERGGRLSFCARHREKAQRVRRIRTPCRYYLLDRTPDVHDPNPCGFTVEIDRALLVGHEHLHALLPSPSDVHGDCGASRDSFWMWQRHVQGVCRHVLGINRNVSDGSAESTGDIDDAGVTDQYLEAMGLSIRGDAIRRR